MAEQILSQLEVDALLKGLSNGDIATETERREEVFEGDVRPYDFSRQEKTIRGKLPTLEMINEKFSRTVRGAIFSVLRKSVDICHEGIKTMKFEEFLKNLQMPSSLNIFQFSTLRGQGILALDPNLVFLVVDSYFGGDGRFHTRVEGRDFTNVEQGVIKKVVDVMFNELKEAWKSVHETDFKHTRSEMNPQFLNIIAQIEPVIVCTFRMDVESGSSRFYFCIPYTSIEPIKDKLYGTHRVDAVDQKWSSSLLDQFFNVELNVAAEVGKAHIHVSEMLNLKVGDVIQLDRKAKAALEMKIEGITKYTARPGVVDRNYALKIEGHANERG